MSGGGRHDLEASFVAQSPAHREQIAVPLHQLIPAPRKIRVIKFREGAERVLVPVTLDFAPGELDQAIQVPGVTVA
jgi:hypothetical protein